MKKQLLILGTSVLMMMSCENPMTFRTKVNEDGSLDKTIIFEKADKNVSKKNIFGISEKNGWEIKLSLPFDSTTKSDKEKFRIQFDKHFDSADDMNNELDNSVDSLFHVHSKFEKRFRWFYTYIRYSETIKPINRFKEISPRDYFNREDSLFIQRLPAEGKAISKADSVYLTILNDKINERFVKMAFFQEAFKASEEIIKKSLDRKWLDTLYKKREKIYDFLSDDKTSNDKIDSDNLVEIIFDYLKIPKETVKQDISQFQKDFNARYGFMVFAMEGKYAHEFEMPWEIVTSNADSVVSKKLYWKLPLLKFAYMDYEIYAECRKINWWAVAISAAIVGFTLIVLWKKPK